MENTELKHHGVLGMRWGIRRYQNKDGTLTPAGKKRYDKEMAKLKQEEKVVKNKLRTQAKLGKLDAKRKEIDELNKPFEKKKRGKSNSSDESATSKSKKISDLTDEELLLRTNRNRLEKAYRDSENALHPQEQTQNKSDPSSLGNMLKASLKGAAAGALKNVGQSFIEKKAKSLLGLDVKDGLDALEKEAREWGAKAKIATSKDIVDKHTKKNNTSTASETGSKSKTKTTNTSKNDDDPIDMTGYKTEVHGEGKSSSNIKNDYKTGPIYDVETRPVNDTALVPYRNSGRAFMDEYLLHD